MPAVAGFFGGWRGLGRFWGLILAFAAAIAATLAVLGPLPLRRPSPSVGAPSHEAAPQPTIVPQTPAAAASPRDRPGRDMPGSVNDPDPALLESGPGVPPESLPRIAPDGRKPMQFYAAGFDPTSKRPRVGLLIAGIGLGAADSKRAIADLPAQVTFAVSPYTPNPEPILSSARLLGHEYLLSIPMEPQRFPLSDAGPNALMTTLSPDRNHPRLLSALSKFKGYVGATAILGALRGERLADMPDQIGAVLEELDHRGLLYVAAPGHAMPVPHTWSRGIDLVVDEPATAADIDARLLALETIARDRGDALGLAVAPRPVTVERIAAWTIGLANRGLALAPVSALVVPPAIEKETHK
ncbi:MAG: divergent polysaccharide deacetylase family protein [Rhodospirillales bacterium]